MTLNYWLSLIGIFVAGVACTAHSAAPSTQPTLRIAMVGLVHGHAPQFFQQYRKHPEIEFVGVAEPDAKLREQYAKKYKISPELLYPSLEALLDKAHPAAVVVYTDTLSHRQVVETCAARGVHVMMEKPLAVSTADAAAIAQAAKAGNIRVIVNYETTWYRSNSAVAEMVRAGDLGEVRKIVVHDGHMGPKEIGVGPEFLRWLGDPKRNGAGALFDFGCYGADLATSLMNGARPTSVTAVTQQIKPDIYPNVDDEATIIATYPKAQAIFQASWNWPYNRKDMEVYGTKGYAITLGADRVRVWHQGDKEDKIIDAPALAAPYDTSLGYFKAVMLDGAKEEPLGSLDTNLVVTDILDNARESARAGKTAHIAQ